MPTYARPPFGIRPLLCLSIVVAMTMTTTITLPPETESRLRRRAADSGQSLDAYVRQLVERDVASTAQSGAGTSVEDRFQQLAVPGYEHTDIETGMHQCRG